MYILIFVKIYVAGHKKCRLFKTYGGLYGLQEAIYHEVPILGLPLGADQTLNILRAARDGYGLKLDRKDVIQGRR